MRSVKHSSYLKQLLWILGLLLLANLASLAVFAYQPKLFYFRPWEYFPEVAYRFAEYAPIWNRPEKSDQTRDNLFYYQDAHKTYVSVDQDGFRSTYMDSSAYPILISGDSAVFGSSLSDDETIAWQLSELLDTPVFNGGRSSLFNVLKRPDVADAELIIDMRTEREIRGDVFNEYGLEAGDPYTPQLKNDLPIYELPRAVAAPRFLITSMALRTLLRAANDLRVLITGGPKPFLFHRHTFRPRDLESAVSAIKERSRMVERMGKKYVFVAIPAKQTLYGAGVDEFTRRYLPELTRELRANGVSTIDLLDTFIDKKESLLYHRYDSHWNANGTSVAAEIISREINRFYQF